jgi:RNA polymerase sigma-70 factor (ECF subfamily)
LQALIAPQQLSFLLGAYCAMRAISLPSSQLWSPQHRALAATYPHVGASPSSQHAVGFVARGLRGSGRSVPNVKARTKKSALLPSTLDRMSSNAKNDVESAVRDLTTASDFDGATTAALRGYGPEVMRFLCALQRSEADASEVFSVFAEDLWKSMKSFSWDCSLRTWAYTIARRASFRAARKKRGTRLALGSSPAIENLVQEVRTQTLTFLRTETKSRLRALRDSLDPDDQALLMLRVDRGLAWDELARVLSENDDADPESLKRDAARLRKRFQILKEKLKELAKRQGIYPAPDHD